MSFEVLDLPSPSFNNYASLLRECSLPQGRRLHGRIVSTGQDSNVVLANLVIQMYGRCGAADAAKSAFDSMPVRNVFSWTILMAAYARHPAETMTLFRRMDGEGIEPNEITLITALGALAAARDIQETRKLHDRVLHSRYHAHCQVLTAVIHAYGRCRCAVEARRAFDAMPPGKRNVVAWNTMVAAYAKNGHTDEAFAVFEAMCGRDSPVRPSPVTFLNILSACVTADDLPQGRAVHARITGWENDVMLGTALVSMYGRCGSASSATDTFRGMTTRNVVSWNAAIAANAQNGHGRMAVALFRKMNHEGFRPNSVTLASALEGCAFAGALQQGRAIHELILGGAAGGVSDAAKVVLWTSLLNMYAKCGTVRDAESIFHCMGTKNAITWNTLLAAYAQRGHVCEVVETFHQMQQDGVGANPITFVNVLYVFSHAGLLEPAVQCFGLMQPDYAVQPDVEHFGCVVDLLGRAGWLNEAEDVIKLMPLKDEAVWLALLNGCRMHRDSRRGLHAAERVLNMELKDSAPYVLLSSIG